jgi:hypothetical protein
MDSPSDSPEPTPDYPWCRAKAAAKWEWIDGSMNTAELDRRMFGWWYSGFGIRSQSPPVSPADQTLSSYV